jgi:hypothetical protein
MMMRLLALMAILVSGCTVLYIDGDNNHVEGSNTHGDFAPIPAARPNAQGVLKRLLPGAQAAPRP